MCKMDVSHQEKMLQMPSKYHNKYRKNALLMFHFANSFEDFYFFILLEYRKQEFCSV